MPVDTQTCRFEQTMTRSSEINKQTGKKTLAREANNAGSLAGRTVLIMEKLNEVRSIKYSKINFDNGGDEQSSYN